MFDQSGSMPERPLSPGTREKIDAIFEKFKLDEIDKEPFKFKNLKNFEEMPEKNFIRKFPSESLRENFNKKIEPDLIDKYLKDYSSIFADLKLSPEERAAKGRERGEALATACHAGTATPTTVMRPLTFRRGFASCY